jgi:hypothetical protein
MRIPFLLRITAGLAFTLTAMSVPAQNLPSMPPNLDPGFWGRTNQPYALSLTVTDISVTASGQPQTHVMQAKLYRDSSGRERSDGFYDSGQPMSVMLRDPNKNTTTMLMVVPKTFFVQSTHRPAPPPPGKGWTVERLEPRVIAGIPAEGLRFTRRSNPDDGTAPVTMVEEDWISNELGVVLERTSDNPQNGMTKTTRTVTHLERVEPDPGLFVVPSDYSVQQSGRAAP